MAKRSGIGKIAMWILLGLLFIGLGGFGAATLSGNIRSVGTVGSKSIPVDSYARQLQNEIQAISQQTGQPLPFARAQEIGLDRAVLQRLVRNRALDHETSELGLSIGDTALRDEILQIPAFQGVDGTFDREGYRFALQQGGLSEAEFEISLREEAARTLLQGAVLGGVKMPETFAETLVGYVAEQRDFTWGLLDEDHLAAPLPLANKQELRSYYDENTDKFMLPDTKMISYALLTPDAMIDEITVPEEELRAEYEARADVYNQPERRLVERLVFADQEAADQAAAALEVGGTQFRNLVEERGLTLADIDLGDVSRLELDAAGEAVFNAAVGEIVGPQASPLGPALFRVNGVLPAQATSFEEARAELQEELAQARAVRAVEARAQDIDDQLAGGATLEQLANETKMELGSIAWHPGAQEGIAAYADFRDAANALKADDFAKINQLEDGSIFAMRLDEELPARVKPFDAATAEVRKALRTERTLAALTTQAEALAPTLEGAVAFQAAGLDAHIETEQRRNAFITNTPAGFMSEVFEMSVGEIRVLPSEDSVVIVRLDAITAAGDAPENIALLSQLGAQMDQALAQDLFTIYSDDVVRRAVPQVDQRALQAVHVNFP
ncbi:peptidylprolyl isomerase [Sulfitobacter sp. M57]|uniref:peptidyl-prolyl cis-trans isomerase n=1 Tax=unclassified Sulfitobacter TaxID=196795 RepID=UPI0023E258B4|nr:MULTISPECIES: peptidyl-prolyl cis-trans isomerase [unclassified Sulfitobacter]MDF3413955.1 peptidylprolyl isomerase [Sulfitobacter sp. KE5]MDF3420764.1 peptidylprolyl isomerase [Sulfitobacter sp. KE43]MDF3432501.1 peptidylprolyl isomerase [Sulfitobacter sp. KE42]MDF3458140.1 peptidylprolyl isomerase [Sulfitobacter sp. S74]MDF3462041.1 peptidylprolyl isomerase [Sulfitobacter sp. Ks18]